MQSCKVSLMKRFSVSFCGKGPVGAIIFCINSLSFFKHKQVSSTLWKCHLRLHTSLIPLFLKDILLCSSVWAISSSSSFCSQNISIPLDTVFVPLLFSIYSPSEGAPNFLRFGLWLLYKDSQNNSCSHLLPNFDSASQRVYQIFPLRFYYFYTPNSVFCVSKTKPVSFP